MFCGCFAAIMKWLGLRAHAEEEPAPLRGLQISSPTDFRRHEVRLAEISAQSLEDLRARAAASVGRADAHQRAAAPEPEDSAYDVDEIRHHI